MGASSVAGRWYDGHVYAAIVDRLLAGVHSYVAAQMLDAACGTSTLSQNITRTGRAVVGVGPDQLRFEFRTCGRSSRRTVDRTTPL